MNRTKRILKNITVIELNNYEGNDDREEKSSIKRGRIFNIVIFRLQEVLK